MKVIIVGGGAAGMLAAVFSARNGHEVLLLEKNEKLGKKLFITGKGRCNVTNACEREELFQNIVTNKKFLYSSFSKFNNYAVMDFFEQLQVPLKVERGNRVFPISDKSSDIIHALEQELQRLRVTIKYYAQVEEVIIKDNQYCGLKIKGEDKQLESDCVIIATGGLSYPSTGSTGDGYQFAVNMGHTIMKCSPSLVPLEVKEPIVKELQGLSLKNVFLTMYISSGKKIYEQMGELLFTHYGISGPLILSASSLISSYLEKDRVSLSIDLKPALTTEQLDHRILRDFQENLNKQFKNSLDKLLPKKLIPVIIFLSGIDSEKKVNLITKKERFSLIKQIKQFSLTVSNLRGYKEAVITKGGVCIKEINPSTMESKLIKNVYFIGEVLDIDALTGGFNLQIAWSTAYAAANAI